jgi:general secretion pathway protein J
MSLWFDKERGGKESGFTLIEVLIAVTILSVILVAVYSTFFLSYKAIEGTDESMVRLQESRRAIDILRCELDSALYREKDANTFFRIQDRDFYGKQASQLSFTTFSPLRPGLSGISYYVEEKDSKLKLVKKIGSPYREEEPEGVDIIEDLEAFLIEAKYQDKWVRTWDAEISRNKPEEIRISLTVSIKGRAITLAELARPRIDRSI